MTEVKIVDKQRYLDENYPFGDPPKMTEQRECLHCDNVITVGDFKVFKDEVGEYICCPNAPVCDGTVIDWMPVGYKNMPSKK